MVRVVSNFRKIREEKRNQIGRQVPSTRLTCPKCQSSIDLCGHRKSHRQPCIKIGCDGVMKKYKPRAAAFQRGARTLTASPKITKPNGKSDPSFVPKPITYASYEEYLASDLWQHIRKTVWKRDRGRCRACRAKGSDVHHLSYETEVMEGKRLDLLVLLCRPCHKRVEFTRKGQKRSVQEAAHAYRQLVKKSARKRRKKKRKGKRAVTAIRPAAQSA